MFKQEFAIRTRKFGLSIIKLIDSLPKGLCSDIISRQMIRSATSVGANYRAACRARSSADFISKLKIVEEEAYETLFWLELLIESDNLEKHIGERHLKEGNEILSIVVACIRRVRENLVVNRNS